MLMFCIFSLIICCCLCILFLGIIFTPVCSASQSLLGGQQCIAIATHLDNVKEPSVSDAATTLSDIEDYTRA